jgi:hypothetical protein
LRGFDEQEITRAIQDAGGAVFGMTSEPQTFASEAVTAWELRFPVIGDPHHEISDGLRARGWLSLFVNRRTQLWERGSGFATHPKGIFQPGILAVSRTGRVLYRWRSRPTRKNLGGALERPVAEDVWKKIQQALAEPPDAPDAPMDVPERFDAEVNTPFVLAPLMMLANGNFLRCTIITLDRDGLERHNQRYMIVGAKWAAFLAGWAAAAWLLPGWIVAPAVAIWAAVATAAVVTFHRDFQNVPSGEPDVPPPAPLDGPAG